MQGVLPVEDSDRQLAPNLLLQAFRSLPVDHDHVFVHGSVPEIQRNPLSRHRYGAGEATPETDETCSKSPDFSRTPARRTGRSLVPLVHESALEIRLNREDPSRPRSLRTSPDAWAPTPQSPPVRQARERPPNTESRRTHSPLAGAPRTGATRPGGAAGRGAIDGPCRARVPAPAAPRLSRPPRDCVSVARHGRSHDVLPPTLHQLHPLPASRSCRPKGHTASIGPESPARSAPGAGLSVAWPPNPTIPHFVVRQPPREAEATRMSRSSGRHFGVVCSVFRSFPICI